ncbi:hypothetical protein [Flavobacterium zepuense]|nr:hypothetical protein [Flavobacterium zepuense]
MGLTRLSSRLVFLKKKNSQQPEKNTMLQNFITSALIIDDKEAEVASLKEYLDSKDIWVKHFTPDQLREKTSVFNNRKLIFLDLFLEDGQDEINNINIIRALFTKVLGTSFGTYGIVLWTKHTEHFTEFINRIFKPTNNFTLPLFAVALDKTLYMNNNYEGLLEGVEEKLKENVASSLFIEWNKSVKSGSDHTIKMLYDLFDNDPKKYINLEPLLHSLALNFTGIPADNIGNYDLQKDLVKSLMDSLQFEISNRFNKIDNLFSDPKKLNFNASKEEKQLIFSKLNTLLMLDNHNLAQDSPIPGNIYEIKDESSAMFIKTITVKKADKDLNSDPDYKDLPKRRICIEMTPPCDFALGKKKKFSRVVGGLHMDYDANIKTSAFGGENFYTFLYPIQLEGFEKPQMLIFDFYHFQTLIEDDLKDSTRFSIIYRAKDKLFADILQKLSSHTARLGIGVLQ